MKLIKTFLLLLLALLAADTYAQDRTHRDSLFKHKIDSIKATKKDSIKNSLKRDSAKMAFSFNVVEQDPLGDGSIMIDLEFKNKTSSPIRLVDLFNDPAANFYISVKVQDGTAIKILKGPDVDPRKNAPFKYIDIAPGGILTKTISLSDIIKQKDIQPLAKGVYHVSITYLNRAGKDCIVGLFKSQPRKLKIIE